MARKMSAILSFARDTPAPGHSRLRFTVWSRNLASISQGLIVSRIVLVASIFLSQPYTAQPSLGGAANGGRKAALPWLAVRQHPVPE